MSTRHLSGVSNNGVGTMPRVPRETGASTVAHRGLARRIADTVVAGCRNFAGLTNPDRPQHLLKLSAA